MRNRWCDTALPPGIAAVIGASAAVYGVMLAGDGLHPSSKGARVQFDGAKRTVVDGPFTEAKELVAGYWLWQVRSLDEAYEWLKKAPFPEGMELEGRPGAMFEDPGPLRPNR